MRKVTIQVNVVILVCFGFLASCQKSEQQQAQPPKTETKQESAQPEPAQQVVETPAAEPEKPVMKAEENVEANTDQLVPLNIKLPTPMFVGTPTNIRVPNLEKPLGHPRPPFMVPKGTSNVALNKPVSSSDEQPIIGDLPMIVDGDKEGAEGSFVELGPSQQNVTIDLKGRFTIYAIVVWHYHKQPVVYHDVIVQVADDRDFISNVSTVFNNDSDNTSGQGVGKDMSYVETAEGKLIDARGVQGRYVRLYSRGNSANDLNHYIEVEVYGKAAK